MTQFVHRRWSVDAVQWRGDNFDEVRDFITKHVGEDCGVRNDYDPDDAFDYNTVQFYAWNDDQEVDLTDWIVVHSPDARRYVVGEIMHDETFRERYERVVRS